MGGSAKTFGKAGRGRNHHILMDIPDNNVPFVPLTLMVKLDIVLAAWLGGGHPINQV